MIREVKPSILMEAFLLLLRSNESWNEGAMMFRIVGGMCCLCAVVLFTTNQVGAQDDPDAQAQKQFEMGRAEWLSYRFPEALKH
ncbi:MAG: hypothetical protein N2C14_21015, partial [Planctomycetales bacterium]